MHSLLDPNDRSDLLERLDALAPDSERQWGTMDVSRMLCHLSDQLRFAVGDLEPRRSPTGPLTWRPVQWFGIVVAPWPRGRVQTSPQLLQTSPAQFQSDIDALKDLIGRFVAKAEETQLGEHPMFGFLPTKLWARLAGRHIDHHLRQFGV